MGRCINSALDADGSFVIAYRVRTGHAGRGSTVVARSPDGEHLTTVAHLDQARFDAASMERPAIVRTDDGRWRLYVCSASKPPSKHWWIDLLEADDPAGFATAEARTVFAGDERTGVKDPIVQRTPDGGWQAWICCHPLDVPDEEDRMTTAYATSRDGVAWDWHGTVLAPQTRHLGSARRPPDRRSRRWQRRLRRSSVEGGELVRAHRAGAPDRSTTGRARAAERRRRGRCPLPGCAASAGWRAIGSGTRHDYPTRATNCGRS